jgi:hypothetical protein
VLLAFVSSLLEVERRSDPEWMIKRSQTGNLCYEQTSIRRSISGCGPQNCCEVDMNSSVETYQKRLRNELSMVEQEIETHNRQLETLNSRLDGLKRALELCDSEQSAVAELLRTGVPDLKLATENVPRRTTAASQRSKDREAGSARKPPTAVMRPAMGGGKSNAARARASGDGAMKRVDMIAAALKRHPRLTVRELIATLEREFGWKCGESNLTAHLYTNPERFSRAKADRGGKQLVTWSVIK